MRTLLILILLVTNSLAAISQSKYPPGNKLDVEGVLSLDGNFFYLYDYTTDRMGKWDLEKGRIAEWITWNNFLQKKDYIPVPEDEEYSFYGPGNVTGLYVARNIKKNTLTIYNSQTKKHIAKLPTPGENKYGKVFSINSDGTYIAILDKKGQKLNIYKTSNQEVIYSTPYYINERYIHVQIAGPWLIKSERTQDDFFHFKTTYYNLETKELIDQPIALKKNVNNHHYNYIKSKNSMLFYSGNTFTMMDMSSFSIKESLLESMGTVVGNNIYEHSFFTKDGQLVYFYNLKITHKYNMNSFGGFIGKYDPFKDFLISESVLYEGKDPIYLYRNVTD